MWVQFDLQWFKWVQFELRCWISASVLKPDLSSRKIKKTTLEVKSEINLSIHHFAKFHVLSSKRRNGTPFRLSAFPRGHTNGNLMWMPSVHVTVGFLFVLMQVGNVSEDPNFPDHGPLKTAAFGMSWFWHPEALFGSAPGIYQTRVGYAGGTKPLPTYYTL